MTGHEAENRFWINQNFQILAKKKKKNSKKKFFFKFFFFFRQNPKFLMGSKKFFSPFGGDLHLQIGVFCFFGPQKRKYQEKIALELVL